MGHREAGREWWASLLLAAFCFSEALIRIGFGALHGERDPGYGVNTASARQQSSGSQIGSKALYSVL
jgi:hypothetical protein